METVKRFQPDTETYTEEGCHIVELHNTAMDADCSIARARLESGRTTRLHCLRGTIERYIILEGTGEVIVGDQPPQTVRELDVVNIPAGVPQSISNAAQKDLIFLCICTPRFRADIYQDLE